MKKNPVCTILWRDAAYTFERELPPPPTPRLTAGFIIEATDEYTYIATNVEYEPKSGALVPVDGMVIPQKAELEFKKIGYYNENGE